MRNFQLELAHGLCVGVRIPQGGPLETWVDWLHVEEQKFAATLGLPRRATWVAGRAALRQALNRVGVRCGPVLVTDRGAPLLPEGVTGSISHKSLIAVAIVAREPGARIGIDIEALEPPREGIERKVLTPEEMSKWRLLPQERRCNDTILRFSIKEAIYKAIDPFLRRIVDYQEVSVFPRKDGGVRVSARLERHLEIEASWQFLEGYVITTSRAREPRPA